MAEGGAFPASMPDGKGAGCLLLMRKEGGNECGAVLAEEGRFWGVLLLVGKFDFPEDVCCVLDAAPGLEAGVWFRDGELDMVIG